MSRIMLLVPSIYLVVVVDACASVDNFLNY